MLALTGTLSVGCSGHHERLPSGDNEPARTAESDDTPNGARIYQTGRSAEGRIPTTGAPHWFRMHGGGCADCHGDDGRGGEIVHMTNEEAPDIRHSTLTSPEHGHEASDASPHEESEAQEETETHPSYTDALIRRAITEGLDPPGQRLDDSMPRWDLSDRDLDDLIHYLKELDNAPRR